MLPAPLATYPGVLAWCTLAALSGCAGGPAAPHSSGGPSGATTSNGAADTGGGKAGGASQGGQGGSDAAVGGSLGGASAAGSASSSGGRDAGGGNAGTGSSISIDGRELVVNGAPFRIRGVNWNPVAKGKTHPTGLDFAGFADRDIALMKAAGINAVRTYERLEDPAVLDKLQAAGIRVFSTVYGWWEDDPMVVVARVDAVKAHPAILAWVIGNEWNYNRLYSQGSKEPPLTLAETRGRLNSAAAAIKQADPLHPVSTIYGEFEGLAESVAAMPDIDIWGINAYRGISFGDLFERFEGVSTKPLYLGEYGADAYDSRGAGKVDLASQAEATTKLTQELIDHYVGPGAGSVALGGFVFEWADEWWKAGSPDTQEVGGVAPGGGPYPDATFNEEYWGVVDIERNPRPAYDSLKALYAQ